MFASEKDGAIRGENITENTQQQAREEVLAAVFAGDEVDYAMARLCLPELFQAVARTQTPAMVTIAGSPLVWVVPAMDLIEADAYWAEQNGRPPLDSVNNVLDARTAFEAETEDEPPFPFIDFSFDVRDGGALFFSIDDTGVPEVAMAFADVVSEIADFRRMRQDQEVVRRIEESRRNWSVMVPMPEELYEGLDLSFTPVGHFALVADYERLKDEAAADKSGVKQQELDSLTTAIREILAGDLEGQPFDRAD